MLNRKILLVSLFLIAAIAISACSGEKQIPEADSVESLGLALEAAGLRVDGPQDNGMLASRFFSVPGVKFEASGETLLAYEFDSEEAAAAERAQVSSDGWGIGAKYINWVIAPNYYSNGKLIVIYDGEASLVKDTLTVAMGERFAGEDPEEA